MVKCTPGENLPGRTKSLRRAVYFRTFRGVLVAAKWPRPRGKPKTEQHRQQVEWFRQAQQLAKRVDPKTQITIAAQTHRSPIMPRDLATSLMSGRTYSVSLGPLKWIRSRRAMSEVSEALDVISNIPGDTLVRGQLTWVGAPLPATGQAWFNPAPELFWTGTSSGTNFAWKGNRCTALAPIAFSAIGAILTLAGGATYRAAFCHLDTSDVITSLVLSESITPGVTGQTFLAFPLSAGVAAGDRFALIAGRTDATGTTPTTTRFASGVVYSMPVTGQNVVTLAQTLPAVGQALAVSNPGSFGVFPRAVF